MYSFEKIINEPVHGRKFYTENQIELLQKKLIDINNTLNLDNQNQTEIINTVLEYVKENVGYRKTYFDCFTGKVENFDNTNLKYRTAYGALIEGEAMCAGYAEAIRVILNSYNINSYTLLSKLPLDSKRLMHYVVAVKNDIESEKYVILDPESEQYCLKKGYNYEDYIEKSIYFLPDKVFTDDVVGKDGAGMLAEEYIKYTDIPRVIGTKNIHNLIKNPKSKIYKYNNV